MYNKYESYSQIGVEFQMTYNTEQKRTLLTFLSNNCDKAYTIEEIASSINVGKSTIYRLIPKLVEDGVVKRFSKDSGRRFLYQFIRCEHCSSHLHMKCVSCGKILHMDNKETETILNDIFENSDFSVDKNQTILFGKCSECND